jgi:heme/copper-type cytochrome/quinol oxidase subunit 3
MFRPVLSELLLFVIPFVLYAVFLWATRAGVMDPESWPVSRLVTLAIVSFALVIGSFIYFAHYTGAPPGSTYVPAHIEDGKFVPGRVR